MFLPSFDFVSLSYYIVFEPVGTVLFPFVGLLVYLFPIGVVSFELLALLGGDL